MQTILLVEDNEMNRDLISRRLKRRGFEVSTAGDGAAGVEAAERLRPDLILMDIGLPILDGYEATRLIKSDPNIPDVPIIGLSAHAMSGDAEKAMEAGCDDYDTKPIDWPRLLAKIQKLLEKAAQAAAKPAPAQESPSTGSAKSGGHLLVVDDTPLHLEMLSGRLSGLGYSFTLARSAAEGLEALASQTYDAALLDVGLEHLGRPFWEVFREQPKAADVALLILSPIDLASEAAACLSSGVDEVLCQPFRVEELKHRLESTISGRTIRRKYDTLRGNLEKERRRTEYLMRSWLPSPMLEELRSTRRLPPRTYPEMAVLSWDLPSFAAAHESDPSGSLTVLQQILVAFEDVAEAHQVQLISIDGNRVMAAAGDFSQCSDPAFNAASCAQQIARQSRELAGGLDIRAGIHVGPTVVAVLGSRGCRLGIWGAGYRGAEKLRAAALPGKIYVSSDAWTHLGGRINGRPIGTLPGETEIVYQIED